MSKNWTRTLLRGMFSVLLLTFIALLTLVFIGIGFAGGLMLASWDAIKDVDLAELEYHKADTWKQHLKFYSSVCTVQREDLIDFLLDKLKRLAYEEAPPEVIKPSAVGEYSIAFDTAGETGTMWVYLQGFHYRVRIKPLIGWKFRFSMERLILFAMKMARKCHTLISSRS